MFWLLFVVRDVEGFDSSVFVSTWLKALPNPWRTGATEGFGKAFCEILLSRLRFAQARRKQRFQMPSLQSQGGLSGLAKNYLSF